ncbi:hypothetical protein [Bradyrhizobium canariense]|uniref:hypothetical protein n=1 Tax=Bradyrhizobium canariense TaxID=255045 RepID=UPI000A18A59F|nr:hypothetical protein [Bradyrhizobium canariense]OSI23721.1 hypothetical protein BST65_20625 [Bradyrhizobium canariense]OSI31022.1 hypothetical protein BST66_21220 [Bradyrhizobium canariense]OSI39927.1 hypothetical protein BSZ20_28770 [Bradyrhizobium canariense]OSI48217.1 hypothetical protein BST67_19250 [Bradyrhizobium canariense]OSI50102.1 hypothetical protein BSZ15_34105 [Bradyrhizobium canariense]
MQYADGSFADVKSISQQAMCRYWARTAGDLPFPSLDQFRPEARLHDPKQLIIWNVESSGDGHKFRALYQGASVGEVFNSSWAGKSMDEVLPPAFKEFGLAAAQQCVTSGCAIYNVFSTYNSGGHTIDCERLLLPLGRAGRVEQMVGSLQLISMAGSFNRETVIRHFEWKTDVSCAIRIYASGSRGQSSPSTSEREAHRTS